MADVEQPKHPMQERFRELAKTTMLFRNECWVMLGQYDEDPGFRLTPQQWQWFEKTSWQIHHLVETAQLLEAEGGVAIQQDPQTILQKDEDSDRSAETDADAPHDGARDQDPSGT